MDVSEFLELKKIRNYKALENYIVAGICEKNLSELIIDEITRDLFQVLSLDSKNQFLEYLFSIKRYKKLCEITDFGSLLASKVEIIILWLKSYWELGHVKSFQKNLENTLRELISVKAYYALDKVLGEFLDKIVNKKLFTLIQIQKYAELYDVENLVILSKKIREKILDGKEDKDLLEKIYIVLELLSSDDVRIRKEQLYTKIILSHYEDIELVKKELIESLLLADEKIDYLLIANCLPDDIFSHYVSYLKHFKKVGTSDFPPFLKNSVVKKSFVNDVNISTVEFKEERQEEESFVRDIKSNFKEIDTSEVKTFYYESDDEKQMLRFLKIANDPSYFTKDLAISFFMMNYLNTSMYLVSRLVESSDKYYMMSLVSLKLKLYSKVVEYCNFALETYHIKNEEIIPFEILKACAFQGLGDKEEFTKIKMRIKKIDPRVTVNVGAWKL